MAFPHSSQDFTFGCTVIHAPLFVAVVPQELPNVPVKKTSVGPFGLE